MILIDDPADPRLVDLIGLRDRELRTRSASSEPQPAVFVAEGDHVVARAVRAGYQMAVVLVDATRPTPLPFEVASGVEVFGAGPEVVRAITGLAVHRGSLAVFARRRVPSIDEVIASARRVAVLERVVNPVNLGVIMRSAAALGIDGLVIDAATADPLYRRASRVAMGEVFDLPYTRVPTAADALRALSGDGFETFALTPQADAESIDEVTLANDERAALVLGSEGPGLSPPVVAACDRRVRIPLSGRVDSLNVGAAAAVAFYAFTR